jgi:hypothetical protein
MGNVQCFVTFRETTAHVHDQGFGRCSISSGFQAALEALVENQPAQNWGTWVVDADSDSDADSPSRVLIRNTEVYAQIHMGGEDATLSDRIQSILKTQEALLKVLSQHLGELEALLYTAEPTGDEHPMDDSERPWLD